MPLWIYIVIALALIGLFLLWLYNSLVRARNMVDESWSGVDVQLKRRRDLIPNLVETVKAYAAHEAQTLQAVTDQRAAAQAAAQAGPARAAAAENQLTRGIGGLFAVAEAYPDLKADANFRQLAGELSNIEDNVAGARSIYNSNARLYNDKVQSFPANLFAGAFGFHARTYFEATQAEHATQTVNLG